MNQFLIAHVSGNRSKSLKKFMIPVLILMMVFNIPLIHAQETKTHGATATGEGIIYEAAEVEWKNGPASFEAGSQFAVLEGDPSKDGYFNMRLKLPDGFRIAPHWHPQFERVTVISGTFLLGHGDSGDRNATQRLEAGSYFSMPPEMIHYAITEGETIVQLATMGPWNIIYVKDEDDPRKRK